MDEEEGQKQRFRIKVKLIQVGWIDVFADSREEAISEIQYSFRPDLWPMTEIEGEEFPDCEFERADYYCE